ncbi:MAG: diguanylate cyclase [Candidatus Eremiobacteraeota bacterium]|nr:diguanylate cyclase [Candidatus Eremiobacteraeota bacterium]
MSEQPSSAVERPGADGEGDAHLVVDPSSGSLAFIDAAAAALFGLRDGALETTKAADLLPELDSLTPREFVTRRRIGTVERELCVRLERLQSGSFAKIGAILAIVRATHAQASLLPQREDSAALGDHPPIPREERLESLWTLVVRRGIAGTEQVRALLREALRGIGLESAAVMRVDGAELVVEFSDGDGEAADRIPLEGSVARAALERAGTFAVLDAEREREFAIAAAGTRCCLCAAFRVGEERWVVTFTSARPREAAFEREDWLYVEHVVEALARSIERRESDTRIERLAYSDSLTALPNRVALLARLDESLEEADRLAGRAAVLFLDIDGFKGVNDTVGHRGGDIVLAEVAQRLRGTLRRVEYIGRLGGDEFAVVMPRIADREEIEAIAQRIAAVLQYPFEIDDHQFRLSASIGVAIYPDDAASREDLLACADAAMYAAKEDGGSRVRFRDAAGGFAEGSPPAAITGEVRDAGYLLCYQPIVEVSSGRVIAAEALIRRIDPLHGLLAPERGWSIAHDETGRRALDRYVLREATAQARAWEEAGTPLRLDVNLAAYDAGEIDDLVADETLGAGLGRLRIELVPALFGGEDAERVTGFVTRCAAYGIGFALDGFDGGLGTLPSLAHLPIEVLKLERSLVEGVAASRTTRAVVEGTIIVARSLGWTVIAKGVETATQQEALVSLGCNAIQGFFVAHPMTAADFGTWLRERRFVETQA